MSIKQNGGVFGRNPTFNDVTIQGQLTFDGDIDINSDLKISGNIEVTNNATIDNTLLVGTDNNSPVGNNIAGGIALLPNGSAQYSRESGTALLVNRKSSEGELVRWNKDASAVGSISVTSSATAYNTSSDYRLKEDDVAITGATERVKALRPINFAWKIDGTRVDGFFAHEAGEVVPECVSGLKDAMRTEDGIEVPDYQGIDHSKLVPILVATIQELEARITALEA